MEEFFAVRNGMDFFPLPSEAVPQGQPDRKDGMLDGIVTEILAGIALSMLAHLIKLLRSK